MKLFNSIKENYKGYLISTGILMFSIILIHKVQFKRPPLYLDVLVTKLTLAPFLLFGLMCLMLLLVGDKE